MIEAKNITVTSGDQTVLNQISFKWKNGLSYGIYSTSGSGKSTLLEILAGVTVCKDADVIINGFDMQREPIKAREFIGFLPQENVLYGQMTPVEYLMYIADVKGMGYEKAIHAISGILDITGVSPRRDCLIENLSLFEKKCIAVAQTALGKSDILILDDPWKGLSPHEAKKMSFLLSFLSQKATMIVSSREKDPLLEFCKRIFLLNNGVLNEEEIPTTEGEH